MSVYSVAVIFLALFSTVAGKEKVVSRRTLLQQGRPLSFRLPATGRFITAPSGSFLDKLGKVKSFRDLYREFKIPRNRQLSFRRKPNKHTGHSLSSSIRPNNVRPSIPEAKPGNQNQIVAAAEVDTSFKATYCQKKKVTVNLPQPVDGSGIHWPYCASVPRCSGCCSTLSAFQKCTAVRTSTRSVDVYYIPYDTSKLPLPKKVLVQVHDQCQCTCRQSASSCNANQVFVSKHCRCECNPSVSTTCPSRFKWDTTSCMCVCKHPATICPRNHRFSRSVCKCVCIPQTCSPGLYFDSRTCTCSSNLVFALQRPFKLPAPGPGKRQSLRKNRLRLLQSPKRQQLQ